jgi:hypothetical protein
VVECGVRLLHANDGLEAMFQAKRANVARQWHDMGWWFWRCYSPDKKREGIINMTLGFHGYYFEKDIEVQENLNVTIGLFFYLFLSVMYSSFPFAKFDKIQTWWMKWRAYLLETTLIYYYSVKI